MGERIVLTTAERHRFWNWLLEGAESDEAMVKQLTKAPSVTTDGVAKKLKADAAAARAIAAKLVATSG